MEISDKRIVVVAKIIREIRRVTKSSIRSLFKKLSHIAEQRNNLLC